MNKDKKFKGGFTLIEALVAISILVIAVIGPLSLASKGLSYSNYAKDEITAFYLANEAIDVIRNIRDTNKNSDKTWSEGLTGCISGCYFDAWENSITLKSPSYDEDYILKTCKKDGLVRFGYDFKLLSECQDSGSTEPSYFSRKVKLETVDSSGNEIRVTAVVSWVAKNGINRSITITENLFNLSNI